MSQAGESALARSVNPLMASPLGSDFAVTRVALLGCFFVPLTENFPDAVLALLAACVFLCGEELALWETPLASPLLEGESASLRRCLLGPPEILRKTSSDHVEGSSQDQDQRYARIDEAT